MRKKQMEEMERVDSRNPDEISRRVEGLGNVKPEGRRVAYAIDPKQATAYALMGRMGKMKKSWACWGK